jgi:hypothetical protein
LAIQPKPLKTFRNENLENLADNCGPGFFSLPALQRKQNFKGRPGCQKIALMIFENLITQNRAVFIETLKDTARQLHTDPEALLCVMYLESGINPAAVNRTTGATGLIQFMPATAAGLGTSTAALKALSNVGQLKYVYRYFAPYAGRIPDLESLYLATFFPAALGKPDAATLETSHLSSALIASQNPALDLDKNKAITVGEFKASIYKRLPAFYRDYFKKKSL